MGFWNIPNPVEITADYMRQLFLDGVIGTKELRNWLEQVDPAFSRVRDTSVDDQIDALARDRYEAFQSALRSTENENDSSRGGAEA